MVHVASIPRLFGLYGAQGVTDLVNPFPERLKASPKTAQHPRTSILILVTPTTRGPWRKILSRSRLCLMQGAVHTHSDSKWCVRKGKMLQSLGGKGWASTQYSWSLESRDQGEDKGRCEWTGILSGGLEGSTESLKRFLKWSMCLPGA